MENISQQAAWTTATSVLPSRPVRAPLIFSDFLVENFTLMESVVDPNSGCFRTLLSQKQVTPASQLTWKWVWLWQSYHQVLLYLWQTPRFQISQEVKGHVLCAHMTNFSTVWVFSHVRKDHTAGLTLNRFLSRFYLDLQYQHCLSVCGF